MKKANRVFVIVLDSFGIGYEPDAHLFGDVGANTLESVSKTEDFNINNMVAMGLGSIDGVRCLASDHSLQLMDQRQGQAQLDPVGNEVRHHQHPQLPIGIGKAVPKDSAGVTNQLT